MSGKAATEIPGGGQVETPVTFYVDGGEPPCAAKRMLGCRS